MSIKYKHINIAILATIGLLMLPVNAVFASPDGLLYPVIGSTNYSDTFLAYRSGQVGNKHHAIDIFAAKHSQIVSPVDGTVRYVGYPQDSWGWYIVIVDDDGFEYHFMHINNDTPTTDDGAGGPMHAYGPDLFSQYNYSFENASRVARGQLLGYLGDSGNAENTPAHLHFEIIKPEYTHLNYRDIPLEGFANPFSYLNNAEHIASPLPYPVLRGEMLPYGPAVRVETNIAKGNLDEDAATELVSGAGPGGGPHVKVFNPDNTFTGRGFFAYDGSFNGGLDVAVGDVDGDGKDEIITGAGKGGGPHVKAFDQAGNVVASFFAYDYRFEGGVRVSAGDVDGDGKDEIITGAGKGGGPHVRVFNASGVIKNEFFAYTNSFNGGVKLSVGEAYASNPGEEIAVAPWSDGTPHVKILNASGNILTEGMHLETWWSGFYDVAAGGNSVSVATGINRRSSVRTVF